MISFVYCNTNVRHYVARRTPCRDRNSYFFEHFHITNAIMSILLQNCSEVPSRVSRDVIFQLSGKRISGRGFLSTPSRATVPPKPHQSRLHHLFLHQNPMGCLLQTSGSCPDSFGAREADCYEFWLIPLTRVKVNVAQSIASSALGVAQASGSSEGSMIRGTSTLPFHHSYKLLSRYVYNANLWTKQVLSSRKAHLTAFLHRIAPSQIMAVFPTLPCITGRAVVPRSCPRPRTSSTLRLLKKELWSTSYFRCRHSDVLCVSSI